MHQRLLQMSTRPKSTTLLGAVFQILQTRARSPSTSPGAIRPLSLSSKNGSAWTSTARTPPRLGHNSIPAALRPSHVSAAEHMFAQRVAQAAAARAISLSPRSAQIGAEQHLRTKMLQLQQTQQAEQQHPMGAHQSPPRKSIRAGLRSPGRQGRLKDFTKQELCLGKDHFLALSWHDIVRQGRVLRARL